MSSLSRPYGAASRRSPSFPQARQPSSLSRHSPLGSVSGEAEAPGCAEKWLAQGSKSLSCHPWARSHCPRAAARQSCCATISAP